MYRLRHVRTVARGGVAVTVPRTGLIGVVALHGRGTVLSLLLVVRSVLLLVMMRVVWDAVVLRRRVARGGREVREVHVQQISPAGLRV